MINKPNFPPFEDLTANDMTGFIRIRFGDFFDVRQPHYTSLDKLDREHCYYLSDAWDKIGRFINNPALDHIPHEALDSVLVWDLGRYDTMIDVDGNVVDMSSKHDYAPKWHGVIPCEEMEKATIANKVNPFSCRLSAMNNVALDDRLDIEASLIYNLYEVIPLTNLISVDYLRYYFWCSGSVDKHRNGFWYNYEPAESLGILFLFYVEHDLFDELYKDTGLYKNMLDCEVLKDAEADIESFEQHEEIVAEHKKMLEAESRKYGTLYLKAAFGTPDYEQLQRLEMQVIHKIRLQNKKASQRNGIVDISSFSGFVSELERFETGFHSIKISGAQQIYDLPLKVVEVVLRAKLWYNLGSDVIYSGIMMNDMLNVLWDYWNTLCKVNYTYQQKKEFVSSIRAISKERNGWAHGSKAYSIREADVIMQRVYHILKEINRII